MASSPSLIDASLLDADTLAPTPTYASREPNVLSEPGLLCVPGAAQPQLPWRLLLAACLLALEILVIAALGHPWLPTGQIATGPIAFLAALLFFGRRQLGTARLDLHRLNLRALATHGLALLSVLALDASLLHATAQRHTIPPLELTAWLASLLLLVGSLVASVVPGRAVVQLGRSLGTAWTYAIVTALLVVTARQLGMNAWDATTSQTGLGVGEAMAGAAFSGVKLLLGLFYAGLIADPATRILGTQTFCIRVAGACSGIEGLAMTFALTTGWIIYERHHLRLLRALWLIPTSLILIWCLNLVRITTLIAIGSSGHPRFALTTFHTEAGWIAVILVAVTFLLAANRIAWFRADTPRIAVTATYDDTATVYLLPFIAILAVSMVTGAGSPGLQTFYPLSVAAGVAALWFYRRRYADMLDNFGAFDVLTGAIVGVLWIALAPRLTHTDSASIANSLATMSIPGRALWLLARVLGATLTVPIAEELAFRGFLARRIVSEDVAGVPYAGLTLLSILGSSIAFGAIHGSLWPLGIVAGLAFSYVARRRDSIGSAVAAHATANLTIAVWVLATGNFSLW